jgi:hypothetical protein
MFLLFVQLCIARRHVNGAAAMCGKRECKSQFGSESLGGVELGLLHRKSASATADASGADIVKYGSTFYLRLGAVGKSNELEPRICI